MQLMARACGHQHLNDFTIDDLTTFKTDMAELSGIAFGGAAQQNIRQAIFCL